MRGADSPMGATLKNIRLFLNFSPEHVNVCVSTASVHYGILHLISVWFTASPQIPKRVDPFSTFGLTSRIWHISVGICEKQGHVLAFL